MLLGKVVVQTKSLAAVNAQPKLWTVSSAGWLHASSMLRGRLACYGNEGAGHLRAVSGKRRQKAMGKANTPPTLNWKADDRSSR